MKAISLCQPWASAMALGFKHIETRSWYTNYRGLLVIHAAKRIEPWPNEVVRFAFAEIVNQSAIWQAHPVSKVWQNLPTGACLCVVKLINCQKITENNVGFARREMDFGDYTPGRYMWITELVEVFKTPIPYRGRQRLFEVTI